jgi:hypothetical protein
MTPAALYARMQGDAGGTEGAGEDGVPQPELVVDLNVKEDKAGPEDTCPPCESDAEDGVDWGEAEEEGLYLVDLSALQFVLVNAYKELEGRVRSQQLEVTQLRRRADKRLADETTLQAAAVAVAADPFN